MTTPLRAGPGPTLDTGPGGTGVPGRTRGGRASEPAFRIQLNALQAMCRQVFGFRLAMIAIATPLAFDGTRPGWPTWLVALAVVCTVMGSYMLIRDWERFGPFLLRHPALLGVDVTFGALLLIVAGPASPLGYVVVCTPLLAGLMYHWRGAGVFASLTLVSLLLAYATTSEAQVTFAGAGLLPGLCVLAGAVGVSLRGLLFRFGAASESLSEALSRLSVHEAVEGERARLAREMHDTVAKTLHGLALSADGLARSADRAEPHTVQRQAELVSEAARRAAREARELLTDLRREERQPDRTDLTDGLTTQVREFETRTGRRVEWTPRGTPLPPLPPVVARQLLSIVAEALENAHRHAASGPVELAARVTDGRLRISVVDDGPGLPSGTSLERLRADGHFGLVGMVERAAGVGARIRVGRGRRTRGTEVRLDLPLAALTPPTRPPRPSVDAAEGTPDPPSGTSGSGAPTSPDAPPAPPGPNPTGRDGGLP
ncbi:two-component sensor histidine kinase [Streptomyces sp. AJS327]|uniref:sensor histidine kinase n=1 Tax=Streptomyces sp. AJS327 TaxID=2545265 RepID=UPI0015DDFD2E|nr:histidine kinase [Streptomyces sp. AJS327]MBA0051316.1 two-component sensor histidine kinase [Streptomyces sp. AJS327]